MFAVVQGKQEKQVCLHNPPIPSQNCSNSIKKDAHSLKWNRFYNKHGTTAGNIPLDLRMEQMNKIVKAMWRSLRSNLNKASAARIAITVDEMGRILTSVDRDHGFQSSIGY